MRQSGRDRGLRKEVTRRRIDLSTKILVEPGAVILAPSTYYP
jgi:hypothetical protein